MPAFKEHKQRVAALQQEKADLLRTLSDTREQLNRLGKSDGRGADRLAGSASQEKVRQAHEAAGAKLAEELTRVDTQLDAALDAMYDQATQQSLVEELDDSFPFLLLPVRIETRFMTRAEGTELWVRMFPDDIAVHTHEETLTDDEIVYGEEYWTARWQSSDDGKGAWRALARAYGRQRAAWIAQATRPTNWPEDAGELSGIETLQFPSHDTIKAHTWSLPPRSFVMPDRFVVTTYSGGEVVNEEQGRKIPFPLVLGPDPQSTEEELKSNEGELTIQGDIKWLADFDAAVEIGMGIKIPLKPPYDSKGFDRLVVLGLRLSADAEEGRLLVEELIQNHHYSADGFGFVPQGTPTNNTSESDAGYTTGEAEVDTGYDVETGSPLFEPADAFSARRDGQHFADLLGIDYGILQYIEHSDTNDLNEAMAMNAALWPATLGYFMDEMMTPVFSADDIDQTREFFNTYVTGRGHLPAIRVGKQPYGVLPTTAHSKMRWSAKDGSFYTRLHAVLSTMSEDWATMAAEVSHVGADGNPSEHLLNMLGLQASSVAFYQRFAAGSDYTWNAAIFQYGTYLAQAWQEELKAMGQALLGELGFDFSATPKVFELTMRSSHTTLDGPLIDKDDEQALSETDPVAPYHESVTRNYLQWLADPGTSTDDINDQRFLSEAGEAVDPPSALLYLMLRHAVLLEYWNSAMLIYTNNGVADASMRREPELIDIAGRTTTKWDYLNTDVNEAVPGLAEASIRMCDFLRSDASLLLAETLQLRNIRSALGTLAELPTARLERIFAEHLDLCAYRLDAWLSGLVNQRLWKMRYTDNAGDRYQYRQKGLYVGAYGWVEDLRPAAAKVEVDPAELPEGLRGEAGSRILEDSESAGFIHGPSLTHAVTAAVLRNAYLTHADADDADTLAVNLSSERVRWALTLLEGVRNGQEVGALLGYELERGLHDTWPDLELDVYIYSLRKRYPLVADKLTASASDAAIETIEARNVVDGYALVEAASADGGDAESTYPYGATGLPDKSSAEGAAIIAEVDRICGFYDAVGDVALAESVFQAAQGNFERSGAVMQAISAGNNPPEPDIINTPRSGNTITNRVALHFQSGLDPAALASNPWADGSADDVPMSAKAAVEPGLNLWLADLIGAPENVRCLLSVTDGETERSGEEINLKQLALQPIDLLDLVAGATAAGSALERRIAYAFRRNTGLADTATISVQISERSEDWGPEIKTLFELMPLLEQLKQLCKNSRPAHAEDFIVPNDETVSDTVNPKRQDVDEFKSRLDSAYATFGILYAALQSAAAIGESYGEAEVESLRAALFGVAGLGLDSAIPKSATGFSDVEKTALVEQAQTVLEQLAAQNAAAQALIAFDADLSVEESAELGDDTYVENYREAFRKIFGRSFNPVPLFSFWDAAELQQAIDHSEALLRESPAYIVDEWMEGLAPVRPSIDNLQSIATFHSLLNDADLTLLPTQLPFDSTAHWVAVQVPDTVDLTGNFLNIVQHLPEGYAASAAQSVLLVDDWVESVPNKKETTGIAIHYNQPNAEAPNVLLLAVSPELTGNWRWQDLMDTLNETLDLAKKRAVEPDHVDASAYAQMLPAMMTAVTTYLTTISVDLAQNKGIRTTLRT